MNVVVNAVCNAVTNGVRRNVQNQIQNQIQSLSSAGCLSRLNESIHRYGLLGARRDAWMGRNAASIGGETCR